MSEIDMAIVKEQIAEIRTDVKTIIDSLGVIDQRYHAQNLALEKALPKVEENKKRLDKLEPIVLVVATIPIVLGGLWAVISAVLKIIESIPMF